MKVLVITPFYAPDLGPSAALYEMLCEDLVCLGCEVSVISAVPHYPTGRVSREFRGPLIQREQRRGVAVTRVRVPSVDRGRILLRLLSFICYQLLAAAAGLFRRFDVLIASNPALEVALPFLVLGVLRHKPIIFSVHELYPDVGVKLGTFRHRAVIRAVEAMERFCFSRTTYVRVLSEGYKKALEARGVPESKLVVIPDWTDTDFMAPHPRQNPFSSEWGLNDSLVVMYAGNIGKTQGLELVLEAAQLLVAERSIRFVLVGDGAARQSLERAVRDQGLSSVRFIPFQPRERLPLVLASADVSLITLQPGLAFHSVPSKGYSILASARPLVAAVDPGTDTWNLVQESGGGVCVEPQNPPALAEAILRLHCDKTYREQLGAQGRHYVIEHRSRVFAARQFYNLLRTTLSPLGPRSSG